MRFSSLIFALAVLCSADALAQKTPSATPAGRTLVTVNGTPLTTGAVELWMIMHAIPDSQRRSLQEQAAQILVDEELVAQFLREREIEARDADVDKMVRRFQNVLVEQKLDPPEIRDRLGFTEDSLRETLSLMPRWQVYLQQAVTQDQIREYFESHRAQFDGTRVRVSQILKKLPADASEKDVAGATTELSRLRLKIEADDLTFAEAAQQFSEAPSKTKGGDIGTFSYRGLMAKELTQKAFAIKPGEISEPFRSPFGVHLIVVTDRQPGQLSLEDARPQVIEEIGQNLWAETVARLRNQADIVWGAK